MTINKFEPLGSEELVKILGTTIKQDETNKVVTFLCQLSAYGADNQFNISFNAPSSTGKSFIPTEVARLFPKEDVVKIAYCSPTAFFHDVGRADEKSKGKIIVDLSRKIMIFLDQPHMQLLERLRPLLSHDEKEINIKITDKSQKQGLRTKNVIIRGYPSVIFCTAGLRIDEQEATRFLLLSPEINEEKIRQSIEETIKKEEDDDYYRKVLEGDPDRVLLMERIVAIKEMGIENIKLHNASSLKEQYLSKNKKLLPRHQRDIKRFISIVKCFALLNCWWRSVEGKTILTSEDDVKEAFKIWDVLSISQSHNLPPYIFRFYNDVLITAWDELGLKNKDEMLVDIDSKGLTMKQILDKHYKVYGRMLDAYQLRTQILPMLETSGLIIREKDESDKRKNLICPSSIYFQQNSVVLADNEEEIEECNSLDNIVF